MPSHRGVGTALPRPRTGDGRLPRAPQGPPGVPWGGGAMAAGESVCSHPTQGDVPGSVTPSPVLSVALPGQRVLIRQVGWSRRGCPPGRDVGRRRAQREQEGSQAEEGGRGTASSPSLWAPGTARGAGTVRQCRPDRAWERGRSRLGSVGIAVPGAWGALLPGGGLAGGPTGGVAMARGTGVRAG